PGRTGFSARRLHRPVGLPECAPQASGATLTVVDGGSGACRLRAKTLAMEAKNADLSALRIDRAADPAAPTPGARRWLVIGLPVAGVVVLAAVLLATSGALGSAVPVRLTPATMVSPMRSGAVLVASGYVVA